MCRFVPVAAVLFGLLQLSATRADEVTIPFSFTANTPAVASQVNANFAAVEASVDDNAVDIAALVATISAQAATIVNLESRLAAVEANSVLALDGALTRDTDSYGYARVLFNGVNVQIVDGSGATESTTGLGNLMIGYNESDPSQIEFCNSGTYSNQSACEANGGVWAANQRSGSHNLILGSANAFSRYGGLLTGRLNILSGTYAAVSGGLFNNARADFSAVSGGEHSQAIGLYSAVCGGSYNFAVGDFSAVTGGGFNNAIGLYSSVSGGEVNYARGDFSAVSGGNSRTAFGTDDWVAGALFQGN